MNNETAITQTRVERLTRFFIEASSSSEIDLTDELALDRAYDEAIQQISVFAKSSAALQDLIAMENLVRDLGDLLREASGEDVEHARHIDRALSATDFEYAGGKIGRRQYSGFVSLFPMNGAAR